MSAFHAFASYFATAAITLPIIGMVLLANAKNEDTKLSIQVIFVLLAVLGVAGKIISDNRFQAEIVALRTIVAEAEFTIGHGAMLLVYAENGYTSELAVQKNDKLYRFTWKHGELGEFIGTSDSP